MHPRNRHDPGGHPIEMVDIIDHDSISSRNLHVGITLQPFLHQMRRQTKLSAETTSTPLWHAG
jgi:hypothetical protein